MEHLLIGFSTAFSPTNIFYCFSGVLLGTFVGVLPGIGSLTAIALLLPVTFYLEPTTALILLAGVYYGAEYGGSTASILLNMPGTPSAAVACLDGYPLSRQGKAGVALFITTVASFVGGSIGIIILMAATPWVAKMTLLFGPAEYTALIIFGLVAAGAITQGSPIKGLTMVVLGLLVGCIGTDIQSGYFRYDFGIYELRDGIHIVVVALGLFGVAEIISSIGGASAFNLTDKVTVRSMMPSKEEFRRSALPMLRGAGVGIVLGPLPGTGAMLASFMGYAIETRISRDPSRFGRGAIEGIASPEAANNAAVQTSFVPMLALGVPGTATTAVMLGALMIHGIIPGPRLVTEMPELFWGVVVSFWLGNLALLILNIPLIGLWVSLLKIPYRYLYPCLICIICIGAFSISNNVMDIWLVLAFGLIGYLAKAYGYEPAPFLIGFVLGPMLEGNLRRALVIFHGDYLMFFNRPISGIMLSMSILFILYMAYSLLGASRRSSSA